MSAHEHPDEGRRRRPRRQAPRVGVTVALTTVFGDPFLPTEIGLHISRFHDAGAVAVTMSPRFAVAEFRLRAASPKRALNAIANRIPRPTAGTTFMFLATAVDGDKPTVLMSTEGWPDPMPEVPEPEEAFYRWVAEDTDSWEVV